LPRNALGILVASGPASDLPAAIGSLPRVSPLRLIVSAFSLASVRPHRIATKGSPATAVASRTADVQAGPRQAGPWTLWPTLVRWRPHPVSPAGSARRSVR